jgi:DNA-binding NarL/FixJ family response regulator
MKCLETRKRNGMTHRRYQLADGRRLSTVELPATVLRAFSRKQVAEAMAKWERGEALRARQARMKKLIAQGVKPTAIAHELGITEQAVRMARKQQAL